MRLEKTTLRILRLARVNDKKKRKSRWQKVKTDSVSGRLYLPARACKHMPVYLCDRIWLQKDN